LVTPSQVLTLSEKHHEERATDSAQLAKMAELERVMKSQFDKVAELEAAQADLKHERENLHAGYQRLSDKHKALNEKS
jgi:predicted nuclease with TOPRIM domain